MRIDGTCGWIFETSAFLDWSSPFFPRGTAKVLWINGPAGYGKTILCANIIHRLKTSSEHESMSPSSALTSTRPATFAYFFFSSDIESRGDPQIILRSWISQLVTGNEEALNVATSYVPAHGAGTATTRELWELLAAIAQAIPQCCLIVDGLDECAVSHDRAAAAERRFPIENRRASFLAQLKQALAGTSARVLVVSRDELDIRTELRPSCSTSSDGSVGGAAADEVDGNSAGGLVTLSERRISADDVRPDIGLFARSIVQQQLRRRTP
jgi:Cdc6-like AAA superfamily ATPase